MNFEDLIALFDYDATVDLGMVVHHETPYEHATVADITFRGAEGDTIEGFLVTPKQGTHHGGILWGHWLGETVCNREQYLAEALALAQQGVVSLLINTMWAQPEWYSQRQLVHDFASGVRQVKAFRRAMDVLLSQPKVDAERVVFVGHDYSGMYGTVFGAVDRRAKGYVFMAITPSFFDWAFFLQAPDSAVTYFHENWLLEPLIYLPEIKNVPILMQFAKDDYYVSASQIRQMRTLAPAGTAFHLYEDADHDMNTDAIRDDRKRWFMNVLTLENS